MAAHEMESCIGGYHVYTRLPCYHASFSAYWRFDRLAFAAPEAAPLGLPAKLLAEVQLLTNSLSD